MPHNRRFSGRNHILESFEQATLDRFAPHLERVEFAVGEYLFRPNADIDHAYFPEGSLASLFSTTSSGSSSEICLIGREGLVGWQSMMGTTTSPHECVVQIAGYMHRLPIRVLVAEFDDSQNAREIILAFINKLFVQVSQTTVCNRLHSTESRLARWLLMCHDRVDGDRIGLTQEFLAVMLGVTRPSVTISAQGLQKTGSIRYSRGKITILDRAGLLENACECYSIVQREYIHARIAL